MMANFETHKYSTMKYLLFSTLPLFLSFFHQGNKLVGKTGECERASHAPDPSFYFRTMGHTLSPNISEKRALNLM